METSTAYQSYLNVMQNYQTAHGRKGYQASFAESFGLIQTKVQEQYDFESNGTTEAGVDKHFLAVPKNMPADVQEAYISAMNSLDEKDKLTAMTLTFDPDYGGEKTQNTQKQDDESGAVEKFLHDLRTKGAAKFLADLNQEKIDKMVEEFKQKLMKEMGDSPEAMKEIQKLVDEFKKNLIEEMMKKMQEELKNAKNVNTVKIDAFIMTTINNNMQEKSSSALKELLKA